MPLPSRSGCGASVVPSYSAIVISNNLWRSFQRSMSQFSAQQNCIAKYRLKWLAARLRKKRGCCWAQLTGGGSCQNWRAETLAYVLATLVDIDRPAVHQAPICAFSSGRFNLIFQVSRDDATTCDYSTMRRPMWRIWCKYCTADKPVDRQRLVRNCRGEACQFSVIFFRNIRLNDGQWQLQMKKADHTDA